MPGFANALPHWTVLADKKQVNLENIIDEHSTEVNVGEDNYDYSEAKNLLYKDCDHEMWKFYSCGWFVKGWQNRIALQLHARASDSK